VSSDESQRYSITLIIPAFNEEGRILPTLQQSLEYLSHYARYEVIVVDDGSTDKTSQVVDGYVKSLPQVRLISYQPNRGKGFAIKTGVENAHSDVVFFMDSDLPYPLESIGRALPYFADHDLVIGARDLPGAVEITPYPWYRKLSGNLFSVLVSNFIVKGIPDTQCGFKGFRLEVARRLFSKITVFGFCFDVEVLAIAQRLGLRIKRLPVSLRHSGGSKVRIIHDSIEMLYQSLAIRARVNRGEYD
jgi:dolichyl-phosphate beta-glucosyltransferase